MIRLVTLAVLALAFVSTQAESRSKRIHVTAVIVQTTFTGDIADPQLGDRLISSVKLFDRHDETEQVGTGTGVCTVASVPETPNPDNTFLQCFLTATFDEKGQIIFGGAAPFPRPGIVGRFGILGGTDDFRKARGEAELPVISETLQKAVFELE
jgi:hypothetical protein